jgi:hypothetical protein
MTAFAALIYGFLAMFVLSAAGHNNKVQRQHSPALLHVGYVLCGMSAGAALILGFLAVSALAGAVVAIS